MPGPLAVWLNGLQVATITERRPGRLQLTYTEDALRRFPGGIPLLSLSLPVTSEPFASGVTTAFLDGLLPEGNARLVLAADFKVRADDTFGLARAIGRDCAGALILVPAEDGPPASDTTSTAEPLTEEALVSLVTNLRNAPLGASDRVRLSLAGVQEKLLLTKLPDGRWGRPVDGTPSTHILKPELAEYPESVENEAFCMRMARHLGLPAAEVATETVAGRPLLVVARYDRVINAAGAVQRLHQEDFCQATKRKPDRKYQDAGGPSLVEMARILADLDHESPRILLAAVTLNVIVGNGDAHGKNFSLLHDADGRIRLAPLYDVISTAIYNLDRLAMYIDAVQRIERVTIDRLVNEAVTWGLLREDAQGIVSGVVQRAPEAAALAAAETPGVPGQLLAFIERQVAHMQTAAGSAS